MFLDLWLRTFVFAASLLLCLAMIPYSQNLHLRKEELPFVDNLFVRISDACRSIMANDYKSENEKEEMKKLYLIYLQPNAMKLMSMEEAFATLTATGNFDIAKQTKIIIHGFNDNSQSTIPLSIAQAYNAKDQFNVLLLDASQIIKSSYIRSVHMTKFIGRRLANILANLENFGTSADDIHLVGISLGAHVAGWAGKYFKQFKKRSLGRISGLDPAGPCYSYADSSVRLDKGDAKYVDVIHVNRGVQGILEPIGHADYYVNGGGPNQPGCFEPNCSHQRVGLLYQESIISAKNFIGVKCNSWDDFNTNKCSSKDMSVMGYGSSPKSRGVYFLRTWFRSPYGLGMRGTVSSNGAMIKI